MKTINAGFSLIELMIVIAIIGILSSIAIPSYQTYVLKAKFAEVISAGSAAQLAVADYILSTGANDCADMPIVLQGDSNNITGGRYPYPAASAYVSEVDIGTDCNIWVVGKDGAFGNRSGLDIVASFTAIIDDTGIVFSCQVQNDFAPNTCTRTTL